MPLNYKQVQKILNEYAFTYVRQKGSHEQWIANGKLATIPHAKEYPPKTAKSILYQIALATGKEYKDIIQQYSIKL